MLATPTGQTANSVAYDLEIKETPKAPTPKRIAERFGTSGLNNGASFGGNMSMEDLNAKLDSAAERKKQFDDMKAMKARADVEKAKYLAMNKKINGPYEPDVSDMAGPFWYEKNSLPMD